MRRLLVFVSGSAVAAYGCSSILSPITLVWITPGWRITPTITSMGRSRTSHAHPRTTRGSNEGDLLLAHGRDPYFAGWPDTLQLDYANPATQEAMISQLLKIAGQCDGVRCDMAMLVLPDVFERTWERRAPLFWPDATRRVRERVPVSA